MDGSRLAITIPAIVGERCVHAHIEIASCRACVKACPQNAWIINDETVGIDTEVCDGCNLCVPACPEGAIASDGEPTANIGIWNGQVSVFYACEYTGIPVQKGLLPCLHAIGVEQLLRWYRRGITHLVASAAACTTCPRGRNPSLQDSVRQTEALLASRTLTPLTLNLLTPAAWLDALRQTKPYQPETALSRRHFFRKALSAAVDTVLEAAAETTESNPKFIPATASLPTISQDDLYLHQPLIDSQRCNGCDACVRLCPHQAIVLERSVEGNLRYQLDGRQCTGCAICQDVCDQNAISIKTLQTQNKPFITLHEGRCSACGASFHVPTDKPSHDRRCRICAKTHHSRLLYQVLE